MIGICYHLLTIYKSLVKHNLSFIIFENVKKNREAKIENTEERWSKIAAVAVLALAIYLKEVTKI